MKAVPSCRKRFNNQSYWKLNTSILHEENFLPTFKSFWDEILSPSYSDVADWWDFYAKPCIKKFCIDFSVQRKIKRSQRKEFLLSYLGVVTKQKDWEEVSRIKHDLYKMLKEDLMGFVVRSRFKQNAEDEKSSLFHAALELKNNKSNIVSLKINGQINDSTNEITKYFGALFNGYHDTNLNNSGSTFRPDNTYLDDMLQHLSSMSKNEADALEEDLDIEELDLVIKECANNKAPGLDGLSYEFYKVTWPIIRKTFIMVLQSQMDRERLLDSDKIGATRLISKVVGVPSVEELRPITLLNTDYRILTKLLVKRIKPVLPSVIKSGQLCTVGKKNILFGISNILSSIMYTNQRKLGACLVSLDFYKAYDRVLVSFLLLVMEKMGFGWKFCSWIRMLHENAKTRFILSKLTRAIDICFSIRQGDPLAMILYILYIEPLLIYIEKHIRGLTLPCTISGQLNFQQSVEAYCDDLNTITEDDSDLLIIDESVRKLERVSGAIFRVSKMRKRAPRSEPDQYLITSNTDRH